MRVKLHLQGDVIADLPYPIAANLVKQGQAEELVPGTNDPMKLTEAKTVEDAPENKALENAPTNKGRKRKRTRKGR